MPKSHESSRISAIYAAFPDISRLMNETQTPGLALGVIRCGEIIVSQGFGYANIEDGIKATDTTAFAIGSLTKAITAAACGLLVSDRALDWDTPISSYLSEFRSSFEERIAQNASIADILCHSTGLPDFQAVYLGVDGSLLFHNQKASDHILKILSSLPIRSNEFRRVWRYNALTYAIPSMVIEKLSGMTYERFLETRLFTKLGMSSTSLVHSNFSKSKQQIVASPYVVMPDNSLKRIPLSRYGADSHFAASCGIQSSIRDLLIWAQAILDSWQTHFGLGLKELEASEGLALKGMDRILQPICHFPPIHFGKTSYALGWFHMIGQYIYDDIFDQIPHIINRNNEVTQNVICKSNDSDEDIRKPDKVIFFHSGRIDGFTSSIHLFPETRDAVIVLGNATGFVNGPDWIARLIIPILHEEAPPRDMKVEMQKEGDERRNRWNQMHQQWLANRKPSNLSTCLSGAKITGDFFNDRFGLEIHIFACRDHIGFTIQRESWADHGMMLAVSFHADLSSSLALTHYHDTIYSFFPSRNEYEYRARSPFMDWSQFLIHLHFQDDQDVAMGLWWQYAPSEDGIWFARNRRRGG